MNRIVTAAMLAFTVAVSPPVAAAPKAPAMTPLQIQQIQTHEFDAPIDAVYPSIITVLQDTAFTISHSDRASGLITAAASAKSKLSYNIWWGMGKKKRTQTASFFVETRPGNRTRVRLNIVNGLVKSNLIYGGARSDNDTPALDPAVYQDIFNKIDQAVFVRIAADAPTPARSTVQAVAPSGPASADPRPGTTPAAPKPALQPVSTTPTPTGGR